MLARARTAVTTSLVLAAGLLVSGTSGAAPAPSWRDVDHDWPGAVDWLEVSDVLTTGDRAWVVGTSTDGEARTPLVQECTRSGCTPTELDLPGGYSSGTVQSISGTSRDDLWAVGSYLDGGIEHVAVMWHHDGSTWTMLDAGIPGDVTLTTIEVRDGARWALGAYDYGDGSTVTVYEWFEGRWVEASPFGAPYFPAPCDQWLSNDWRDLTIVRGKPVLTGFCDAEQVMIEKRGKRWHRVDAGLPAEGRFFEAAVVGGDLWVAGRDAITGTPMVQRRTDAGWEAVPTTGLPQTALVLDLDAARKGRAWMVGRDGEAAASWRWDGSAWSVVDVPSSSDPSRLVAVDVSGKRVHAVGYDARTPRDESGILLRAKRP